jgi:hypothetical protein
VRYVPTEKQFLILRRLKAGISPCTGCRNGQHLGTVITLLRGLVKQGFLDDRGGGRYRLTTRGERLLTAGIYRDRRGAIHALPTVDVQGDQPHEGAADA